MMKLGREIPVFGRNLLQPSSEQKADTADSTTLAPNIPNYTVSPPRRQYTLCIPKTEAFHYKVMPDTHLPHPKYTLICNFKERKQGHLLLYIHLL